MRYFLREITRYRTKAELEGFIDGVLYVMECTDDLYYRHEPDNAGPWAVYGLMSLNAREAPDDLEVTSEQLESEFTCDVDELP